MQVKQTQWITSSYAKIRNSVLDHISFELEARFSESDSKLAAALSVLDLESVTFRLEIHATAFESDKLHRC